jgi:tetratricopeptide (TPR) repeat protein
MVRNSDGTRPEMRNEVLGPISGQVVQARSVGDIHFHATPRSQPAPPAQLPLPPRKFAGRDGELALLARLRSEQRPDGPLVVVLTGPAGVGKSTLALRWLGGLRDAFADGQLFVTLDGQAGPVNPGDVLGWFLVSLGVAPKRVPDAPEQRASMYRSITSTRHVAIMLDDAVSAGQVRTVLPAGSDNLVVVTSRSRLSGLAVDDARWVEVVPLDESGSFAVLADMLGADRVSAEPAATRDLAQLCAGLPLALSIVGARLSGRPQRAVGREVAELRSDQRRLEALRVHDNRSVAAVLDSAYQQLDAKAQALYRMCSAHPGTEFGLGVAAAATGWPVRDVAEAVEQLLEANFLSEVADSRFAYHDVLRLHARGRCELDDPAGEGTAAARRILERYLDQAVAADVVIHPLRPHLGPRYQARIASPFADEAAAFAWLEEERASLRSVVHSAAERGWDELAWQLCEALWGFFLHTRHYGDWIAMHAIGIPSAARCGDRRAEARLRSQLGFAYAKLHRYEDAIAENAQALALAEAAGDELARSTALSQLGRASRGTGDLDAALRYFRAARDIQHRLGQWRGVALCRRRIGDILVRRGEFTEAVRELRAAATVMAELDDRTQLGRALLFLGKAHRKAGQLDLAATTLREALATVQTLVSPFYQADVLAELGTVAEQQGDLESAARSYRRAGDLYAAAEDPQAAVMRSHSASLEAR